MKRRKVRKGISKNTKKIRSLVETRSNKLVTGSYGLKALQFGRITAKQIEAARKAIRRSLKRLGDLRIRIYPDRPVTKKPNEVRMGKGKGAIEYWACIVKPGRILFEIGGNIAEETAANALRKGSIKLPIATRYVTR
jgi:large subunit ribosomal protein L16